MAATDYVSTRRLNEFYNEGVKPLERSKADSLEYDPENQVLQLKAGDDVLDSVTVSAGGESSIAVADVSGASISSIGTTARIMWSDPADTILNGVVLSRWGGTVLVRKEGSAPTSKDDGTRIIDNKTRNRYAAEAYEDTGLEYGKTYYYRFFPYTTAYRYTNGSSVSVTPARIIIPAIPSQSGTITYDGTEKTVTLSDYDESKMTVTGNTATNAGTHTAVVTPKEGYCWGNGSTEGWEVPWTIGKATLIVPTQSGTITYDGTQQEASWDANYIPSVMSVTGGAATNAGTRTATFHLLDPNNYKWSDGSTTDKEADWTIQKARFTAVVTMSGYTYGGTKSTPSVSNNPGGGAVAYYGRASSGGTATDWNSVTGTTYNAGQRFVYAVIAETENYEACTTEETAFTISKATFTAQVSIAGYTYAGTKSTPTVTSNPGNGRVTFYGRATATGQGTAWDSVTNKTFDAGKRYIYAVIAATDNYEACTTENTEFTIAKASFTSTVSVGGYTYGGTKSTPTVSNNPGNGAVTFYGRATSAGAGVVWGNVDGTTFDAGTRYCYAEIAETTNYLGLVTDNQSFTIAKADASVSVSTTEVSLTASTTYKDVTIARTGDGTLSVTSDDTGVATVALRSGSTYRITGVANGTATITASVPATTNYKAASKTISVTAAFTKVYGAEWDGTSTTRWSRTDESADFADPVPYVSGASSYGSPFDDLLPWSGMVKEERTGGTMVKIPKFYYKLTQSGSKVKVQIADGPKDGFSVSPAHMDRGDGNGERDYVYVGRYHCHTSDYKSKTGGKPKASITRSTARTAIHNLGANIWQMDFATRFTLWLLYIVEFADWNSQNAIGYGCGNNSSTENMGYTDSMPYHTGTTKTSRSTKGTGTQYRYIEGLWDNVYDWCDGCYYDSNGLNIILNPNSFSDSSGGTLIGKPSSGYPSAFAVKDVSGAFPAFIPTAASGSATTYSCDYWYYSASNPCLCVGGNYYQFDDLGLFCVSCNSASGSSDGIGARLLELP